VLAVATVRTRRPIAAQYLLEHEACRPSQIAFRTGARLRITTSASCRHSGTSMAQLPSSARYRFSVGQRTSARYIAPHRRILAAPLGHASRPHRPTSSLPIALNESEIPPRRTISCSSTRKHACCHGAHPRTIDGLAWLHPLSLCAWSVVLAVQPFRPTRNYRCGYKITVQVSWFAGRIRSPALVLV